MTRMDALLAAGSEYRIPVIDQYRCGLNQAGQKNHANSQAVRISSYTKQHQQPIIFSSCPSTNTSALPAARNSKNSCAVLHPRRNVRRATAATCAKKFPPSRQIRVLRSARCRVPPRLTPCLRVARAAAIRADRGPVSFSAASVAGAHCAERAMPLRLAGSRRVWRRVDQYRQVR
jgi:hypothetical protein